MRLHRCARKARDRLVRNRLFHRDTGGELTESGSEYDPRVRHTGESVAHRCRRRCHPLARVARRLLDRHHQSSFTTALSQAGVRFWSSEASAERGGGADEAT